MKYKSGILWVSLILLLVLGSSCGTSRKVPTWIPIRDVPMKNFGYNQKREVGVYVESGKDSVLDMVLTNVIELELMASGYKPVNLFKLIHPSVKSSREKARLSVDSVRTIAKTNNLGWFVHAESEWSILSRKLFDGVTRRFSYTYYSNVAELHSRLIGYSTLTADTLFAFDQTTAGNIYQGGDTNWKLKQDPTYAVAALQVGKALGNLPMANEVADSPGTRYLPVRLVADVSYRNRFPDWRSRLQLRLILANDILEPQFGIKLKPVEILEWKHIASDSFELSYHQLIKDFKSDKSIYTLGFIHTLNMERSWEKMSELGMGSIGGQHSVIRAQPSMPSIGRWNPVEEALTIVHELGHNWGGVHTFRVESIQYPSGEFLSYQFDPINREIIRSFSDSAASLNARSRIRKLAELYSAEKKKAGKSFYFFGMTLGASVYTYTGTGEIDSLMLKDPFDIRDFFREMVPDTALQASAMAAYLNEKKNYTFAESVLDEAIKQYPDDAELYLLLSFTYLDLDREKEAWEAYHKWEKLTDNE
ncbi:MAG: hypothetical protein HUU10_03030 [Bacteroidetes bacterium]|nr:hypothetical protein [Bacteroidota bacterium]